MNTNHNQDKIQTNCKSTVLDPDFKLESWQGPTREFRFVGWRDDYSAFFVLDEQGGQAVIQPGLFHPETPIRFPEPPTSIIKVRVLPPPCRPTAAEADLLREMRLLAHGRGRGYQDAIAIYATEATKRGIKSPTRPEKWELIYEDALAPKTVPQAGADWKAIQSDLQIEWCASMGWAPDEMRNNRNEFIRRHGVSDMATLARISYKMEFRNFCAVWLVDCQVGKPDTATDLDQIAEFLTARPELVHLTPAAAENQLGLAVDAKHRTLKQYCAVAKLEITNLTRADLPALAAVGEDRLDAKRRAGLNTHKKLREKDKNFLA
jgi:hypothetical protein